MEARSRVFRASLVLLAIGVVVMSGCSGTVSDGPTAASSGSIETVYVEVDVFSGLENPECVLEGADAQAVVDAFDETLPVGVAASPPSVLGFRGLILVGDALPGGDDVRSIRVVPEGYYVEDSAADMWFVDDPIPYSTIAVVVGGCLDESLVTLLPPVLS